MQKLEKQTSFAKCPIQPSCGLFERSDRVGTKLNLPCLLPGKHLPGITRVCSKVVLAHIPLFVKAAAGQHGEMPSLQPFQDL